MKKQKQPKKPKLKRPKIPKKQRLTINLMVPGKDIEYFDIPPAPSGTCPECATIHDFDYPHDKNSLFYLYTFYYKYKRWPTWNDALNHCSIETKNMWNEFLKAKNIKIDRGPDEIIIAEGIRYENSIRNQSKNTTS